MVVTVDALVVVVVLMVVVVGLKTEKSRKWQRITTIFLLYPLSLTSS